MAILESDPAGAGEDADAIVALRDAFRRQQQAFAADRAPSLAERRLRLQALMHMMLTNRERIAAALSADFGAHPAPMADLIEVLGVLGRARHVLEHLEEWMRPLPRETDAALLGSARAYLQYQPKGVVGNIVPWNFPFDLAVGPLIEMLAAGNRVILKPSEYTPASGQLLREMVAQAFDPALVHVVAGGVELARAFPTLPWNHLLYTGSPDVGRSIMAAAARNLTPVTLELGGKCPAILTAGTVTARNVESVIGTKTIKNGQMCITVDYCLVPRGELEDFIRLAGAFLARAAPDYSRGGECTGIVSPRHLERIEALLQEAQGRGCRVITLEAGGRVDRVTRRMPLSLVIDPPGDLRLMREEIFGPLLPVVPYGDLSEALELINAGERPLGLYVFSDDPAVTERVLAETHSGGAAVNTCALQGALPSLGFGGVGASGMGRHHGIEGFHEFSNPRGVVVRGQGDMIDVFYAPHTKAAAVVAAMLAGG